MKRLKSDTSSARVQVRGGRILGHNNYPKIVRLDNESCEYYWKPTTGSGRLFVTIPLKAVRTMNLEVGKTLKVVIEKQSARVKILPGQLLGETSRFQTRVPRR
jgi:hypothetical protein